MIPVADLHAIANELGITVDQAGAHIREAIEAGLLEVVDQDEDAVTIAPAEPRRCSRCRRLLNSDDFYRDAKQVRQRYCRSCNTEYQRERRQGAAR